jgi:twitching motility protein PilU
MKLKDYLRILAHYDGSDLYLTADLEPKAKFQGKLKAVDKVIMTPDMLKAMAYELMNPATNC